MRGWLVTTLKAVIAVALVGSAVVQVVMVALLWLDTEEEVTGIRVAFVVIGVLGVVTLQVIAVCIWRLVTMARHGTVFSPAAFRYVDTVIGSIAAGAALILAVAVVARFANHDTPGDEVAPGMVALICGFALVAAGGALVVYVMRVLLTQAVALDSRARHLQSELDEVI